MLIWMASYPRSGSSLTQQVLWQCFGKNIARAKRTKVSAKSEPHIGPDHYAEGLTLKQIAGRARAEDGKVVVKTHDLPEGSDPAIVIVRDGRAVMSSFTRHQNEIAKKPATLEEIIRGKKGSWSEYVEAWLDAPVEKVVLRYEKLRVGDPDELGKLGRFIDMPQLKSYENAVEEMRLARPLHVQVAADGPGIAEVESQAGDLFWELHGRTMERLGYRRDRAGDEFVDTEIAA
jgi:hypothetical protein